MKMNNINRDNYELFFLLYIDNEMSAAERKTVEEFMLENPDLNPEFLRLQQTVLPADKVIFEGKMNLYKSQVQDNLLQQKLLMHLDGELDKEKVVEITALLQADGILKADWEILQQTKLDAAEIMLFPDKNLLYRKERADTVAGSFVRWAVAAAIIGAGLFVGVAILNKKTPINNTAKINLVNKNNAIAVKPLAQSPYKNIHKQQPLVTEKSTAQNKSGINSTEQKRVAQKQKQVIENLAASLQKNKKIILPALQKNIANNEKPLLAANTEQKLIEKPGFEKINAIAKADVAVKPATANTLTDNNLLQIDNNNAITAGLTDAGKENNTDRILYMNEETVSRSKAGGFFRKLKRVIERNTNIKTDKGLRIGGFELAIK